MTQYIKFQQQKNNYEKISRSKIGLRILPLVILYFVCLVNVFAQTSPINFSFTLGVNAKTSAGVFKTDGTLIRTLWSGVDYTAGTYTKTWDKKDDNGNLLSGTDYVVKVVSNNVSYTWDGVVGNTSSSQTGKNKIRHLRSMSDMCFSSTTGYYATGFVEGNSSANQFALSNIQSKSEVTPVQDGDINLELNYNATDGNYVYWAGFDAYGTASCTYATKVSDGSEVLFSSGKSVAMSLGRTYAKAIDVMSGTSSNPSGIAVQKSGNFLFISHNAMNQINVFNKSTGAAVTTFSITAPGDMVCDANNDLWVISGTNTLKRYTVNSSSGALTAASSITGLSNPISLSSYGSSLAVADAGTSQIKCFDISSGSSQWTLGQANGYASDATVTDDKFFFWDNNMNVVKGFVSFGTDGSIWVGDAGNNRVQHYSSSRTFVDRIMYIPMSYCASVNISDPTRVFSEFLEFKVDYSKTLSGTNGSWTLVKNWKPGLSSAYWKSNSDTREVMRNCVTLSNGRTYGTVLYTDANEDRYPEVFELVEGGRLRATGVKLEAFSVNVIEADGTIRYIESGKWYERKLTGFSNNNPVWGSPSAVATAATDADAPNSNSGSNPFMTSNSMLVLFDRSNDHTGYHLAAVKKGSSTFAWKVSPSTSKTYTGAFPADGGYDIGNGVEYAGGQVYAADRSIFWNYVGEFWKNSQTNKWNHYYDNGLFINQFGITTPDAEKLDGIDAPRMAAGNAFAGGMVKVGSDYYIYHCDESVHGGLHRWKVTGLNTIKEDVINLNGTTPTAAEINIKGNNVDIVSGSTSPNTSNNTDFGSVNTGSSVTKTFIIYNTGNAALSVSNIAFSGTNASLFSLVSAPTYPLSIAASGSYTITVKYAPTAAGASSATITISNSDADESGYNFALKGTGVSTAPSVPDMKVSGNGVNIVDGNTVIGLTDNTNFGTVAPGNSVTKTFVVSNAGTAALSIRGCTFSGANASDFTLVSAPAFPLSVAVNGSYTFTVQYKPASTGVSAAIINFANNDATKSTFDFALQGTCTSMSPLMSVAGNSAAIADEDNTPSTLDNTDFGSVNGGSSLTKTFVISNKGNAVLAVTGITFTGINASEYTLVTTPAYPLAVVVSGTYTVTVKFAPTAAGKRTATLNIASNDATSPNYNFDLAGNGVLTIGSPKITVSGNGVNIVNNDASPSTTDNTNFGSISAGSSVTKTFVVKNTGTSTLSISKCSFTGTYASEFGIESEPVYPLQIAAGNSYTFTVKFAPAAAGTRSAKMSISSDDATNSSFVFSIQGIATTVVSNTSGTSSVVSVTGNTVNIANGDATPATTDNTDFGTTTEGSTITKTFVIKNNSTSALYIGNIDFTGTGSAEFLTVSSPSYPVKLAAGKTITISVMFRPWDPGTYTSSLNIYKEGTPAAIFNFTVKGVATAKRSVSIDSDTAQQQTTGINNNAMSKMSCKLYPMPFVTYFNVDLSDIPADAQSANVTIYDMSGKVVKLQKFDINEWSTSLQVNAEELPSGIYILNVQVGNQLIKEKILK